MVRSQLTFISGGVRSGKSSFAEAWLVKEAAEADGRLVYIASGTATDEEMACRIRKHRSDRAGQNWLTIEQPTRLEEVLNEIWEGDFVLWDCLTTWLANEMYDGWETESPCIAQAGCMDRKADEVIRTIQAIANRASRFIIVSNEVLDEPASIYEETRNYCEWIGRLHRQIVQLSATAVEMDYGVPIYWKREEAKKG
ncbi:bifunctional adenosylcobinamide kinase/adenosylcobinamide-phosphate guanylyltransferase [Sporosarcina sp. Te-1]|uniref:bifunctional adenosylcobinamide kinase/adenosylcobinamide-phosphate guanylyltransferase n=1 Tax=Sporosarcina sp. Te-1 TaxID=2818390 RepID=UPI001A9E531C|nr:bifunctional adenosylcobinamide kinase/adenosylcobinamide-phosphate guanylyltransferase [Sporosarcina sp. Te-1]QTD40723.1 bifunctional adenosylcobinamide kinase/adenosylcobinamide-phosphate guanylyltransferase [Sporosarcina sp. Te-1]